MLGIVYNHTWTVTTYADRVTRLDAVFGRCPVRTSVEISGVLTEVRRCSPLYHTSRLIPGHSLSQVTPAYFHKLPTSLFSGLYHSPSYRQRLKMFHGNIFRDRIISSTNFNAQFSLFINNMYVTLLSSTCFEH